MKQGPLTYKYIRQRHGVGRYGVVTIEIIRSNNFSTVKDACEWKTFKEMYSNFIEFDILNIWKESAIKAATEIINNYFLTDNIEVIISDLQGLYVDTHPSHIGAATIIGIFDYIDLPLNQENIQILESFVESNKKFDIIPDYTQLHLKNYEGK